MSSTPSLPQTPKITPIQIANADAQAQKTVFTAGASGSKVVALMATSSDTSARDVQVSLTRGGTSYPLTTVSVPIGAGNSSGVVAVDLLNTTADPGLPLDSDNQHYLFLESGDTLTVSALTTVTAGKLITVVAVGANF